MWFLIVRNFFVAKSERNIFSFVKNLKRKMVVAYQLIDFKNPVFLGFALWSVTLALKMMYLSVHTAIFRFKNQVCFMTFAWNTLFFCTCGKIHILISSFSSFAQAFANPEDGGPRNVRFNNDEVERVRR